MHKAIVLPGMGATSQMYSGLWQEQSGFDYLDWPIEYVPKTIPEIAEYLAESIHTSYTTAIGSSLGGMVALELASCLGIENVILLGSAISSREVNPLLSSLTPLATITPLSVCQKLAGKTDFLLPQMYSKQNPEFIRAMIKAIPNWSYTGSANIYRIHGANDHIIKCQTPDVSVEGGHLIAITHPSECIESILRHGI